MGGIFSSEARWKAFDSIAVDFDRFRPGYPPELIDAILSHAALSPDAHILEIGCGSGRAALPYAERGYRITCLEPGPGLAAIAKRNLSRYPRVGIEVCTFEDWECTDASVDLILAAQSFHLVDPVVGVAKSARTLKAGGSLAVFGNEPTPGTSRADRLIHRAYLTFAPHAEQGWRPAPLQAHGEFASITTLQFQWTREYTAHEYVGLMATRSPLLLLVSALQRQSLLSAISRAITEQGSLSVTYIAHLCLATRPAI